MAFIPYADPTQAAATIAPAQQQTTSIVPFQNNDAGITAAYNTPTYQVAAANQAYYNNSSPAGDSLSPNGGSYVAPNGQTYSSQQAFNDAQTGAINSAYDINKNYYTGLLNNVDPEQQASQNQIGTQYGDQINSLTHQRDAAYQNLDTQTSNLNNNYSRNLSQLGDQVRTSLQGQLNSLGTHGAGDSSATGMLGYALARQQNQARGNMLYDLNQQLTGIGQNRDQYNTEFNDQKKQLDDWKAQQYQNIASQFADLRQQITGSLVNNEAARQQALASAGAWAANQVQAVNNTLGGYMNTLNQRYQQAAAPTVGFSDISPYQSHNIVTPSVSVGQQLQQQSTPEQVLATVSPFTKKDQTF